MGAETLNPKEQILSKPRCCIKFAAWIHQTLHQRGMAVKSMPFPRSIQEWPLESILKRLETAFLWGIQLNRSHLYATTG